MSVVTTSPMLPSSVLESFEGIFLDAWIGHKSRVVSDGSEFVWFQGDCDLRGLKSPKVLDLDGIDLDRLLELGTAANTPLSNLIVEVLRNSDADDGIFPEWNKIDILALFERMERETSDPAARGKPVQVEDFLFSLLARHQEEIPYLETRRQVGGTLVTPHGVESFKDVGKLEKRRGEFVAAHGAAEPSQDDDDSYWTWLAVTNAINAVFGALGR